MFSNKIKTFKSQSTGNRRLVYYPKSKTECEIKEMVFTTKRQYLLLEFKVQLIKLLLRVIYPTPVSTAVPNACCEHQVCYSALQISLIQDPCIKH